VNKISYETDDIDNVKEQATMKKIVLLMGLWGLLGTSLQAQTRYKQCLDEGMVKWSILDYHIIDAGLVSTEWIAFGDTLINDKNYKKIYLMPDFENASEDNENWKNQYPDDLADRQPNEYVYLRESEDASKLYLYDAYAEREYLMSDMNLQPGDTLYAYQGMAGGNYAVDSVYAENDLKRIRLFSGAYGPLIFTEGVGPDRWWAAYLFPYERRAYDPTLE
jgi:hypothetical protein